MDFIIYGNTFFIYFNYCTNPNIALWYRNLYHTFLQFNGSSTSEGKSDMPGKF